MKKLKPDLIEFMENIAKKQPARVVVCEGWDERCIQAASEIVKEGFARIVLLGDPKVIEKKAKKRNLDISEAEIIDFRNSKIKHELVGKLVELRRHKGLTREHGEKLISDENYFACMYAYCGYADAVAGSAICPTSYLMRPALQILRQKGRIVSEVSVIRDVKKERIFFGSDASLNISPSAHDLAQITLNAADCARSLGIEPKVAMLSFSTKGSGGNHPITETIREAVAIVKKNDPTILIDGELQVDAAVNRLAAQKKCPDSPLKGDANILIFPDLTSANIFAHGMMQFSDLLFDFTIIKGLFKPVGIIGRSTDAAVARNVIVSCAMQANSNDGKINPLVRESG